VSSSNSQIQIILFSLRPLATLKRQDEQPASKGYSLPVLPSKGASFFGPVMLPSGFLLSYLFCCRVSPPCPLPCLFRIIVLLVFVHRLPLSGRALPPYEDFPRIAPFSPFCVLLQCQLARPFGSFRGSFVSQSLYSTPIEVRVFTSTPVDGPGLAFPPFRALLVGDAIVDLGGALSLVSNGFFSPFPVIFWSPPTKDQRLSDTIKNDSI